MVGYTDTMPIEKGLSSCCTHSEYDSESREVSSVGMPDKSDVNGSVVASLLSAHEVRCGGDGELRYHLGGTLGFTVTVLLKSKGTREDTDTSREDYGSDET